MKRHERRARLTITELMEELDTVNIHNKNFSSLSRPGKREVWNLHMKNNFPLMKSCFSCGSDATSGLIFHGSLRMTSWHNGGALAHIECERCRLEFKGEYGIGLSVLEQWNSIGEVDNG